VTLSAGRTGSRRALSSVRLGELRGRVRAGLDAVELVLAEVVVPAVPESEAQEHHERVAKIVGEAAMLLRIARRVLPDARSRARIAELAERLAPYARGPDVRRALVLRPSRAPMHALAHACLTDLGLADADFDRLARLALTSSVANANERVPYRMLDAAWVRHLLLGDDELDHPALPLSPIGAGVDLLAATTEDGYAFTHALVYVTDFGRISFPPTFDVTRLGSTADGLCIKALDEDDLDLLAEVLMAARVLRVPWTPIQTFSFRALDATWDRFGFVPGPGLPPPADGEDHGATVRRVLGTAYHTMFVSSLCAATIVSVETLPPDEVPPGPRIPAAELGCRGSVCRDTWDETPQFERDRLGELVLGFRLRRAVADGDLQAIGAVVEDALGVALVERPLFEQATELLERVFALKGTSARAHNLGA
jgi:hypothetical protein